MTLAASGLVWFAVSADGYQAHDAQLNDGGIWVTNGRDGFYGRVNKPIGQLDAALFAQLDTSLDVVQDGAAVVGHNVSEGLIAPIDPASVQQPEGEVAALPGGAQVRLAGGTLAVADPATGRVWADRVDTATGAPPVSGLDRDQDPSATAGGTAALAVTSDGAVVVVSAVDDTVTVLEPRGTGFAPAVTEPLDHELPASTLDPGVSAVGDSPVVLDPDEGALQVVGGARAGVEAGSVLQQAGPEASEVLVAGPDALVAVDLETGDVRTVADGVAGRPAEPVRLGDCVYGAWSGGTGVVVTRCGDDDPVVASLATSTTDLVFRVNRDEILLNDRATGAVWDIDSDQPARLDDWDAFKNKVRDEDDEEENEKEDSGDRRPPEARPDAFGARPGRTTVLHPLDNDTAPGGRLLSIRSVEDVSGSGAEVTISPDGQTAQIRLPEQASGTTTFEYHIDDGRQDVSDHATVTVTARQPSTNADPHLREGFEPREWTVPSGGVLDLPVLPDWRDKEDGDALSLDSARVLGGAPGAEVRTTGSGRLRFTAPVRAGLITLEYAVTDGIGAPVTDRVRVRVQDKRDRQAVAAVAEPDVVAGEVGRPITIRPLGNDLPGSDPVTPDTEVTLAGKVAPTGGADVETDLVDGVLTFRSDVARTYFLDYDVAYGNAPFAPGRIRVDVRPARTPPEEPVAMPDTVTLHGQSPTLVDVLANDVDPTGGMLVVQQGWARTDNQLDVAVVDGRWLRISARQGTVTPSPQLVRYTISNGRRSGIQGEVVVTQRETPRDDTPVTETDRVVVRAGASVTVPVLDNDFSPSGESLSLVGDVAGEEAGRLPVQPSGDLDVETGEAYVAGRFVRYVAPADLDEEQTFTVGYVASNPAGRSAPGTLEVSVVPRERENQLPEPPVLEARTVSGETVRLRVPGAGVDPDGDPVTVLGIDSAPALGRVVRHGANSLEYLAYPGSAGTDEFTYTVSDTMGGVATGSARVAVAPPDTPQPPLAVPDTLTVEPGRLATVDVLANDVIASGDRVSVALVSAPDGVELTSETGPLELTAPETAGQNLEVVYRIDNGLASSQATVTLRTASPWNNPPVVFDAFGDAADGDTVTVDVLRTAYDPDGPTSALRVTDVRAPAGMRASFAEGSVTVERGEHPRVLPFTVSDADGGAATASLFVPAADGGLPYVRPGSVIRVEPGESVTETLADHVVDPAGGEVRFTLRDRVWASPVADVAASVTDDGSFEVAAGERYAGPGAVSFEVTAGDSSDDRSDGSAARRAVLAVPVQVGDAVPILRCPQQPVEVSQAAGLRLDVAALCHVWTPDEASALSFDADWETSVAGLSIIEPSGEVIEVAADGDARPGSEAVLQVSAGDARPGRLRIRVVKSPPPSLAPIRVADMRAGTSRTLDLAPYLRAGVADPVPRLLEVTQTTDLPVDAQREGDTSLVLTTTEQAQGRAEFRVVMTDVVGDAGVERQVEGVLSLEVLNVPDAPSAPVPGRSVRSEQVRLAWRAPDANGAPVSAYEVRADDGTTTRCASTACDVTGLTNGRAYTFTVRARNAVGWSSWSGRSASATPDAKPGRVGRVRLVRVGDGELSLRWDPPSTRTSKILRYHISWPGGQTRSTRPAVTATGLDNNRSYVFTVWAENSFADGETRSSAAFQSVGTPPEPPAPTVTDEKTPGDQGAVSLSWPETVRPNGPGPVTYTVLRNGTALAQCTDVSRTTCDDTAITYDGTDYRYAVQVTNGGGKSATGAATTWKAVGEPADWADWTLRATGKDNQAQASFTVPASRGAESTVKFWVDGREVTRTAATGAQTRSFTVPDNDSTHAVRLEVCNEGGACSQSSTKNVQTWGPLTSGHIVGITPQVDGTRVSWSVSVDNNGDPARVRIRSARRDVVLETSSVDEATVSSGYVDLGHAYTEDVTVTLSDTSPSRPGVSKQASYRTKDAPDPTVSVSRGARCGPRGSANACTNDPSALDCTHASCGRVVITTTKFSGDVTCRLNSSNGAYSNTHSVGGDTSKQLTAYFGYPNGWVTASCSRAGQSATSPRYDWPDS
ncbi:Ig-like domain-containing protein [Myroides odoratimimus subsp. xuanwuensis]